jgi:hypothetical protein
MTSGGPAAARRLCGDSAEFCKGGYVADPLDVVTGGHDEPGGELTAHPEEREDLAVCATGPAVLFAELLDSNEATCRSNRRLIPQIVNV